MNKVKRTLAFVCAMLILLVFSPLDSINADSIISKNAFTLPLSLQRIEEEAFAGIAARTVVFRDGLISVGENAFQNVDSLVDVFIPPTMLLIAESSLPKNTNLTIHGVRGSYIYKWAHDHSFSFIIEDVFSLPLRIWKTVFNYNLKKNWVSDTLDLKKAGIPVQSAVSEVRSMRPQDRPELNPIDYRFP